MSEPSTKAEFRLDATSIGKFERTPIGGVRIPARLTRTGVLVYNLPGGGQRRELRHPDEVFNADSIATLRGAVVTDKHPPSGVVDSATYKQDAVGHVEGPATEGSKYVTADVVVQDARVVGMIERGERREISCGYRCDLEVKSGEWNGERYDAIQRNVRYNHISLGPRGWGRAGSEVALRVDGADVPCAFNESSADVKTIRIDGKEYEFGSDAHIERLDSDSKAAIAAKDARISALEKDVETGKGRVDSLDGEVKKLKADLATATDQKRVDSMVAQRVSLCSTASAVLGDEYKFDGKTDLEIMVDAIKADDKDFDAAGKSEDRVRGHFESMARRGGVRADSITSVVRRSAESREDSSDNDIEKARKARDERAFNAGRPKPAAK